MSMIKVLLILIISRNIFGGQSTFVANLDKFDVITEELSKLLSNCKALETENIGVLTHSKSSPKWSAEFIGRSALTNLKDTRLEGQIDHDTYQDFSNRKLFTFIIVAYSPKNFRSLIELLKRTILWNSLAFFIVLDSETTRHGCKNSMEFLRQAWQEDILSSTFLCYDLKEGFMIYTYNPYTPKAPKSWQIVTTNTTNRTKHPWTLLKQRFIFGRTTCDDLNFDKLNDLGGYPFNVLGLQTQMSLYFNFSRKHEGDVYMLRGTDGRVAREIFPKLNATLNITIITNTTHSYGFLPRILSGDYDMMLNNKFIFNKYNLSITYPHINSGLSILSRIPTYETQQAKILKFMNPKLIIGMLFVFLGTVFILVTFTDEKPTTAYLDVLRIVLGATLMHMPRENPLRIYLITVIVLFMLTNALFQSKLSSLLTTAIPRNQIDGVTELKKSDLPIYIFRGYQNVIYDEVLYRRLRVIEHWDCSEQVKQQEEVVCVAGRNDLIKLALEKNLYLSRHRILTLYSSYVVRPNWPLVEKISWMLMHMVESGLIEYWYDGMFAYYKYKWEITWKGYTRSEFRIMKTTDLAFAFYTLLLGHALSSIIFLFEIWISRKRKPRITKKKPPPPLFSFTH